MLTDSLTAFRDAAHDRIERLMSCFLTHGISDVATAKHKAIIAVAGGVKQQANIMAFSETFYLLGFALLIALKQPAGSGSPLKDPMAGRLAKPVS